MSAATNTRCPSVRGDACHRHALRHDLMEPSPGPSDHAFNAPTLYPGQFWPVLFAPKSPTFRADKSFIRCLSLVGGVAILEPFWERPAGPKLTRAEQEES